MVIKKLFQIVYRHGKFFAINHYTKGVYQEFQSGDNSQFVELKNDIDFNVVFVIVRRDNLDREHVLHLICDRDTAYQWKDIEDYISNRIKIFEYRFD
jgi:hypothetical protein